MPSTWSRGRSTSAPPQRRGRSRLGSRRSVASPRRQGSCSPRSLPMATSATEAAGLPGTRSLTRARAERAQQRGAPASGADHEDGQRPCAAAARESAWHYRHPPRVGAALRKRREGQPGWAVALADGAQARLHRRQRHRRAPGKPSLVANVAVARELTGCIWAVLPFRPGSAPRPDGTKQHTRAAGAAVRRSGAGRGWMSDGRLRRMRAAAMRQRRPAPSIRDAGERPLPAKHGHAARPRATRENQSGTPSQQRSRSSISSRLEPGRRDRCPERVVLLHRRSLHTSCDLHGRW